MIVTTSKTVMPSRTSISVPCVADVAEFDEIIENNNILIPESVRDPDYTTMGALKRVSCKVFGFVFLQAP